MLKRLGERVAVTDPENTGIYTIVEGVGEDPGL